MDDKRTNGFEPLLIDVKGVASALGVSKRTVERMHANGVLPPSVRIGKTGVRWRMADIREWVNMLQPLS